jgi:xanthine dehydrogenase accessory factor
MSRAERVPSLDLLSRQSDRRNICGNWLRPISGDWPSAVCRALEWEAVVVRVVVAEARGSTPREPGTCMLVGPERIHGTVGGGHLEWQAIQLAREFASRANMRSAACALRLVLASQLGQCCGGVVELWLERLTRADLPLLRNAAQAARSGEPVLMASALADGRVTRRVVRTGTPAFLPPSLRPVAEALLRTDSQDRVHLARAGNGHAVEGAGEAEGGMLLERLDAASASLWLYGAGHVGQALVRVLSELPIAIKWIDSRAEIFPRALPDNVRAVPAPAPALMAAAAPPGVRHLVMTHDHALDYELVRSLLQQNRFCWLGLIGSASKGARFRSRLRKDGIGDAALRRLICPIGVAGVEGKAPGIIAIAVAAQLLQTMGNSKEIAEAPSVTPSQWAPHPHTLASCQAESCASCMSSRSAHA